MDAEVDELERRKRLWEWTLHEDVLFNQRQNFFLVAESMLAVAYTTARDAQEPRVACAIGAIGFAAALIWTFVNHEQLDFVSMLQDEAEERLPDYRSLCDSRTRSRTQLAWLFGYAMPLLIMSLWVTLLLVALF